MELQKWLKWTFLHTEENSYNSQKTVWGKIMDDRFANNRRFYEKQVKPLIEEKFPQYAGRIAVGIAGEGSDCFGYDDFISRDHDFGTGVCLWVNDEDMETFGYMLSIAYNELAERQPGNTLTERLKQRRGVMTIRRFYSYILGIDCDTENCRLSEEDWQRLDHTCLATAVNGEVFRDDLGEFTAFRKMLLGYYPERIWKTRIVNELHKFSSALQVNYARCMSREDLVTARACRQKGVEAAMELFFLMKREYPPYYKWTYKRMTELDNEGVFSKLIYHLAEMVSQNDAWEGRSYDPNILNTNDGIVNATEHLGGYIAGLLKEQGLIKRPDPYLERHVDEILDTM